jgi:hypothetical protein
MEADEEEKRAEEPEAGKAKNIVNAISKAPQMALPENMMSKANSETKTPIAETTSAVLRFRFVFLALIG